MEISSCGQTVSGEAYLTGDLDCSAYEGGPYAVVVNPTGSVDLGGFALTLPVGPQTTGVYCLEACRVANGTIRTVPGRNGSAINSLNRVTVENVSIEFDPIDQTDGITGRIGIIRNVAFSGDQSTCLDGFERLRVSNLTCSDGHSGARASRKLLIEDSTVTGNHVRGVEAERRLVVRNSVITGNGLPGCVDELVPCADVASLFRAPTLRQSSCDTSARFGASGVFGSWGICGAD